ncbi:hypothetical protein ACLOJK_010419 [Asimina triloba]
MGTPCTVHRQNTEHQYGAPSSSSSIQPPKTGGARSRHHRSAAPSSPMQARQIRRATASNPSQIQPAARSTSPIICHLLQPATSPPPSELAGETVTASDPKSLILLASASSSHAVRLRPFQPDLATARARGLISSRTHQRTTASNASFHQRLPDASIATSGSSSHRHDHDPFRRRSGLHDAPQLPLSNDGRRSDARPPSPHPPATIQPANLLTHQQIDGPDSDLGSISPM